MADDKPEPTQAPLGLAAQRYQNLVPDRESFLERARECAGLTIPYLFRPSGDNGTTQLELPWNSLGAYALSNFTSKVVFTLFPPGQPPMKLSPDAQARRDLVAMEDSQQRADMKANIDKGLSRVEEEFVDAFEEDGDRARLTLGVMRMVCGGTQGFQFLSQGQVRGIPLDRFVCKRDLSGNLLEFVVEDPLSWSTLPDDIREKIKNLHEAKQFEEASEEGGAWKAWCDPKSIMVYTHGRLITKEGFKSKVWEIYQEVWGFEVADSRYVREPDLMPYLFAPWILLEGEDYGRSYVEAYEADLQTIEANTQTISEGAAALARILTLVRPGGLTSRKAIAEAENGAVLSGRDEDVATVKADKAGDFQVAESVTERAEQRISRAFLLYSSVQRKGERVTAEEIRTMAQDLEDAQVGAYSQQVVTLQLPFVKLKMWFLQRAGRVTKLPPGLTKVTVLGGLAALGRNAELAALREWVATMQQMLGEAWLQVLGPKAGREIARRAATALKVREDGLIPSEEEAAAMDQQQMLQSILQQPGAQEIIKQLGSNLTSNQVATTNAEAKVAAAVPPEEAAPPPEAQS